MKQMDVQPDTVSYNALINGYCMLGDMDKAKNILELSLKCGIKPNVTTYHSLMNTYCKMRRRNEVSRVFAMIPANGLEHNCFL